jgi:hypothetical protein
MQSIDGFSMLLLYYALDNQIKILSVDLDGSIYNVMVEDSRLSTMRLEMSYFLCK